jgi:general secretion pathway protein D
VNILKWTSLSLSCALTCLSAVAAQPANNTPAPPAATAPRKGEELRLNFRDAPLQSVLDYLSDAAGFIIVPHTGAEGLKGKVTMWSDQPVTEDEALALLNSALDRNGYTAVRDGRILSIYTKEQAQKEDLPVHIGDKPDAIPRDDRMITQILPVHFLNAVQLLADLKSLKPDMATWLANEGGNSLIITDTEADVHRLAEIVAALDTGVASVSTVKVFQLNYADAKEVASVIKDLFAPDASQTSSRNTSRRSRFLNFLRGQAQAITAAQSGRTQAQPVVAVAEELSNSVVVSAPEEQMPIVEEVIAQLDTQVEDITEVRVFHLKYADAQETADLLMNLFATGNNSLPSQIRFGGRAGARLARFFRQNATASSDTSARLQKEDRVVAVPDLRTDSVVVSAARQLMPQIADMIEDLDADPANKQGVFVFDLENTDPQEVQQVLQNLFPAGNGNSASRSMNSMQQAGVGNQLSTRARQNQTQANNRTTFGNGVGGIGLTGR